MELPRGPVSKRRAAEAERHRVAFLGPAPPSRGSIVQFGLASQAIYPTRWRCCFSVSRWLRSQRARSRALRVRGRGSPPVPIGLSERQPPPAAAGKPVVVTAVGPLPETIGENGVLITPHDPTTPANGLVRTLERPPPLPDDPWGFRAEMLR
jgi:glycosyltransferase involved in cell wall biosynthesis